GDGGKPGIGVSVIEDESGNLVFIVRDNGVGMPPSVALGSGQTMGMTLLPILARQLGGTLTLRREGGTVYTLSFPRLREQSADA
ncbi:MAG: sensor histidine kinase, partial [Spirochaetes bacterium]|nr:sensor histidine kinase [Spirochaetota bacterium]